VEFEVIAEGLAFPEGPVVMPDGSVILVELAGGKLTRAWGQGRTEVIVDVGGGPNGAQLGPDGAIYLCNNGGINFGTGGHRTGPDAVGRIERVDLATGKVERVFDHCDDHSLSAPNDLVFDAVGGLWFTDMGKHQARSQDMASVYYCAPGFSAITEIARGGVSFNGIGLSPDGSRVYVADTKTSRVWTIELDAPGTPRIVQPKTRHAPLNWLVTAPRPIWFDSLAVTAAGNVCIGTIAEGGITTVTPAGELSYLALPDPVVTNIAFGGADMCSAYITLASTGRLIKCHWPEPGLKLNFGLY
jgi:gluconolactonase